MGLDSSDIPAPGQPVALPPAFIQIRGESVALHSHPAMPEAALLEIRNSVASAGIGLTVDGLQQIIEACQVKIAEIKAASNGGGLHKPDQGLYDPSGRKLT